MQGEGQIARIYIDLEKARAHLKPESATAHHAGVTYKGDAGWKTGVSFFRNDIKDLIDTRTIVIKTNGQPLYSYYNVHRVYTEGAELDGSVTLLNKRLILGAADISSSSQGINRSLKPSATGKLLSGIPKRFRPER